MHVTRPQLMVPDIATKFNIGEFTKRKAVEILDLAEIRKLNVGKSPVGMAAAALRFLRTACLQP